MENECKYAVGIDFGHGEVTASCIYIGSDTTVSRSVIALNINSVTERDAKKYPSLIYKYPSEADPNQYEYSLDKMSGIVIEFKGKVGGTGEKVDAFRAFIKEIYKKILVNNADIFYKNHELVDFKLYIAAPTKWNTEEKNEYKCFFDKTLGKVVEWVMNESDAAYYRHKSEGNVLILDYGSSTIDYTLMINNRKVPIDYLSNQLGASQIENEILLAFQNDENGNYTETKRITECKLRELNLGHIDVDQWLLFEFRKIKENVYTAGNDKARCSLGIDILYRTTRLDFGVEFYFEFKCKIDKLIPEYKKDVKADLLNLKLEVDNKLEGALLSKIVLSGGASQMPWVLQLVEEVFPCVKYENGRGNIIKDSTPAYVVSEGIVKYAEAQLECLKEIEDIIRGFEDDVYYAVYKKARQISIRICIKVALKVVCDNYANAESNDSVQILIDDIEKCFDDIIKSKKCQKQFENESKLLLRNEIFKVVSSAIAIKFGVNQEDIAKVVEPDVQNFVIYPLCKDFYNGLSNWVTEVYEDPQYESIRQQEYSGFFEYAGSLTMNKARKPIMRKHLGKKVYEYICEEIDFALSSEQDAELINIIEPLKEAAIKCGRDTFYRNELFNTKFKS